MAEIKYHYALNDKAELVAIESVTKELAKICKFTCLSCGEEMIACACESKKVRPYFRHKVETNNCGSETYLHKLAKLLIKEKFYQMDKPFQVQYYGRKVCCKLESCKIANDYCSYKTFLPKVDLHRFYDTCTEESVVGNFVADLLISDSTGKYKTPVLIEVKVTHGCTREKIDSDYKIIEFIVKNEEDIIQCLKTGFKEIDDRDEGNFRNSYFYNFNPKGIPTEKPLDMKWNKRFWYYRSGSCRLERSLPCSYYGIRTERNTLYELDIDVPAGECSPWSLGLIYIKDHGVDVKNCLLCKYHHYDNMNFPICALYKSKGTPRSPKQNDAQMCNHYSEADDEVREIRKLLQDGKVSASFAF